MYDMTQLFESELQLEFICTRDSFGKPKSKRFVCPEGLRPYSRFFLVVSGSITFYSIDDESEILTAVGGDIVYLPDNVRYISKIEDTQKFDFITALFCLTDKNGDNVTVSENICIMTKDENSVFFSKFKELSKVFESNKTGYKFICRSMMWKLAYKIFIDWYTNGLFSNDGIYKGILYIENHYKDFNNVNDLAKRCGLCPSAFRKKFKASTGKSPIEYRNYIRVKRAVELLLSTEYNVSQAADAVGFSDSFYFCKTFKKIMGDTPKKCINSAKKPTF